MYVLLSLSLCEKELDVKYTKCICMLKGNSMFSPCRCKCPGQRQKNIKMSLCVKIDFEPVYCNGPNCSKVDQQ